MAKAPKFPILNPRKSVPNPAILNILVEMKNNALSDYTIRTYDMALTHIARYADLNQPEQVKQYIANKNVCNGYKRELCIAYNKYAKHYGIEWKMPKYRPEPKPIKIPTQEKLEMLIASAGTTLSIKLQISKETGMRPIEIHNLKAGDIDIEQKLIYPTTAKHGTSRTLKISNSLRNTIADHISKHHLNPKDKLFKSDANHYGNNYRQIRNRLAEKLNDPSFKTIKLYDFRHYFATMLYHKTRDILLVKQQMGHKKIETTLIYTQLLNLNDDEWTSAVAENLKDAQDLIEHGFEYVTEMDGYKIFKKRK